MMVTIVGIALTENFNVDLFSFGGDVLDMDLAAKNIAGRLPKLRCRNRSKDALDARRRRRPRCAMFTLNGSRALARPKVSSLTPYISSRRFKNRGRRQAEVRRLRSLGTCCNSLLSPR